MEVWGPRDPRSAAATALLAPIEAVLARATRMAAGVHTAATEGAGARQRGVTPNVLFADTHVLSALDASGVAHLRFCERTRHMPAAARPALGLAVPANLAPDLMGAAVRGSVTSGHPMAAMHRDAGTATRGSPRSSCGSGRFAASTQRSHLDGAALGGVCAEGHCGCH